MRVKSTRIHHQLHGDRTACGYWRSAFVTSDRLGLQLWTTGKHLRLVTDVVADVTCEKCLNEEKRR